MSRKKGPPAEPEYFILDPEHTDSARIRAERDEARKLRKSDWWQQKIRSGICHYCEKNFPPTQLTMDHVVPLARGGRSTKGNLVPACADCNRDKKLSTPVEDLLKKLAKT